MGRCYDIVCHKCRESLWIGLKSAGELEPRLALDAEMLPFANKFLSDHLEHPLQIIEDQKHDYADVLPDSYYE